PASLGLDPETIVEIAGSLPVGSTADLLGSVGSANIPLTGAGSMSPLYGTPSEVDESITETKFLRVEESGAYEYWFINSAAMQREVVVEVVPSRTEGPAPVLYMLDGVDSPATSGYKSMAKIDEREAFEDVHVVTPTRAYAAYWTDWEQDDPTLGRNKWETFLTEELPDIVQEQLDTNGKNAVGGISMGGQAAMHLAATHELYDAVMSFSGYYSTTDQLGYQTIRLTVETRGGDVENMWGPFRSERWRENDTIAHPEGLRGKKVYFNAANGEIGADDLTAYSDPSQIPIGIVLERGVLEGTKDFERVLKAKGIDHLAEYADTGLHNWNTFLEKFDDGFNYIKPALGL
ncbi:MAG TPA: esterase family protein, partial [Intrasporangiaceae bacterium]|nr:esterase family protein [Intrasporangiaceae bacterium]